MQELTGSLSLTCTQLVNSGALYLHPSCPLTTVGEKRGETDCIILLLFTTCTGVQKKDGNHCTFSYCFYLDSWREDEWNLVRGLPLIYYLYSWTVKAWESLYFLLFVSWMVGEKKCGNFYMPFLLFFFLYNERWRVKAGNLLSVPTCEKIKVRGLKFCPITFTFEMPRHISFDGW